MNYYKSNSLLISGNNFKFSYDPNKLVLIYDTSKEPINNTISFPVNGISPNINVDWGDGLSNTYTSTGWKTHTYENSGIYIVQVSGNMRTLNFGIETSEQNNKLKLVRCLSFGNIGLTSLLNAFRNCINLVEAPLSLPTTSNIFNISGSFFNCSNFNSNITSWNTTNITNMASAFSGCSIFNQNIGSWNTSNVTAMNSMFLSCSSFNQNISSWNTSNVNNMNNMFRGCVNFNQNIGSWNVSNVTNTVSMFYNCINFNQNLGSWNVSKVLSMNAMFYNCDNFTSNLGSWNLSGFNTNLALTSFMLQANGMNTSDYDATLIGWNNNKSSFRNDLRPHFGGSKYSSAAASARSQLISYGWIITDGGLI